MILNVYSVYDKTADIFHDPVYAVSDKVMLRDFELVVNEGESFIHQYPNDFALFKLGSFDCNTGDFDLIERVKLCEANSVWKRGENSVV